LATQSNPLTPTPTQANQRSYSQLQVTDKMSDPDSDSDSAPLQPPEATLQDCFPPDQPASVEDEFAALSERQWTSFNELFTDINLAAKKAGCSKATP